MMNATPDPESSQGIIAGGGNGDEITPDLSFWSTSLVLGVIAFLAWAFA